MRFILLLPALAEDEVKAASRSDREQISAIRNFNEEMVRAGVLLATEWCQDNRKGIRVQMPEGRRILIEGPFREAIHEIAGLWIIEVKSQAEAIEWATRYPLPKDGFIEIHQVFEYPGRVVQKRGI